MTEKEVTIGTVKESVDKKQEHKLESRKGNGKTEIPIVPKDKIIVPLSYADTKLTKEELYEKYKDIDNMQSVSPSSND